MGRRRLDEEMVARGLSESLDDARRSIEDRLVLVGGSHAMKFETQVSKSDPIELISRPPFVSRGGEKLAGALRELRVEVTGKGCLDVGAGSGGFTDCLLQAGAATVTAVDVGYGQFDWKLRSDPRVRLLERTHIAKVTPQDLGAPFDLVTVDLSFTSLAGMIPTLARLVSPSADVLLMVKPQFEAERTQIPPGGVVKDPQVWMQAVEAVARSAAAGGLGTVGTVPSRLRGVSGNQEFFLHCRLGDAGYDPRALAEAVRSAT